MQGDRNVKFQVGDDGMHVLCGLFKLRHSTLAVASQ